MRKLLITLFAFAIIAFGVSSAQAALVDLFEWGFNIDSDIYNDMTYGDMPEDLPGNVDDSGFDWVTGLGSISISINTPGAHSVIGYFDLEIDEAINTFFNENGMIAGSPAAGQSWEIDEPFIFGDIFTDFENGTLDNMNGVPPGSEEDVAMAMGWEFSLAAGETATVDFMLGMSDELPVFHIIHTDPDSNASIYLSSSVDVSCPGCNGAIPEPGTLMLLGSGLAGLAVFGRKIIFKK